MNSSCPIARVPSTFIALAVPFLIVITSIRLLLSYEFLQFEYERPGFPADPYGFTTDDRLEYGMVAIAFLFNDASADELAMRRLPREKCWPPGADADCPLFSMREIRHLADTQELLNGGFALAVLSLILAVTGLLLAYFLPLATQYRAALWRIHRDGLRRGAIITLALVLVLATLAAAAWDRAFDAFHRLFFTAGTWRFPYSDSLIRLYPEQLFVDAALFIGGFAAASAILILLLLKIWRRYQR